MPWITRSGYIVAASWLAFAALAAADPEPAQDATAPTIERGVTVAEVRSGFADTGDWQVSTEFAHGVTDWWQAVFIAEWEGPDAHASPALAFENVFDFVPSRAWPIHLGAYVEYEAEPDAPDTLEINMLFQRERGPLDLEFNWISQRVLASNEAWTFTYVAQATYEINEHLSVGVQGLGDAGDANDFGQIGRRAQFWGPLAEMKIAHIAHGDIELQLGYLAGINGTEANGLFRMTLGYEFGGRDTND